MKYIYRNWAHVYDMTTVRKKKMALKKAGIGLLKKSCRHVNRSSLLVKVFTSTLNLQNNVRKLFTIPKSSAKKLRKKKEKETCR